MILLKTLRSHQIHTLFKLYIKKPPHCDSTKTHLISSISHKSFSPTSIFQRPSSSLSSQFQQEKVGAKPTNSDNVKEKNKKAKRKSTQKIKNHRFNFVKSEEEVVSSETPKILFVEEINKKTKKPLDVLFKEAVGLSEKVQESESESDSEIENDDEELNKALRKLEVEVTGLRENGSEERENLKKVRVSHDEAKPKRLSALFRMNNAGDYNERIRKEFPEVKEEMVFKELSSDMALFANFLYKQGYFTKANFLRNVQFDVTCFENNYGRDFLKFEAEKFAMDNAEVAQWLSSTDLKKVAEFGCRSLTRKNVFSAKALRIIFGIQEEAICKKCVLKQSCKYVNHSVWKKGAKM